MNTQAICEMILCAVFLPTVAGFVVGFLAAAFVDHWRRK